MIDENLHEKLQDIALGVAELVATKNADYGPSAISQAPGGPLNGIHVRLHDKLQRAIHIAHRDPADINHESQRDVYVDVLGYALIALMVLDGKWPGTAKKPTIPEEPKPLGGLPPALGCGECQIPCPTDDPTCKAVRR